MEPSASDGSTWSRRRLAGTAAAIVLFALLVAGGAVVAVVDVVSSSSGERQASNVAAAALSDRTQQRRTEVAAEPMMSVAAAAAWPPSDGTPLEASGSGYVVLPSPRGPGPQGVMSGFPHTEVGAVAQLTAVTTSVLRSMAPETADEVRESWSLPSGRPSEQWELRRTVDAFRQAAGITGTAPPGLFIDVEPAAGLFKGADGPDWVLACALVRVRATLSDTGEVAYGTCAAMQWTNDRWLIDPSHDVAAAPSTWPGSAAASQAGWQPFAAEGQEGLPAADVPPSDTLPRWSAPASSDTTGRMTIDIPNPITELGGIVSGAAADAWTSAMLAVWGAGLMVLRIVLTYADLFLTPDLRAGGPGRNAYVYTFWIASTLVLLMLLVQLGTAVFKREASGLARAMVGAAQFVLVWSCWLGYCVVVVATCGSLAHALMGSLLGVSTWSAWDPVQGFETSDVTEAVVATVLGLLGCVLWLAAIGHLLVMLARAASLIVLVATGPIAAAGLVADAGRAWFWKSLRWFHAAALTPVLMVLVMGIGAQVTTGVATGLTTSTQQAVGTALPAVLLLCVACVAPMALFKMLAFVDPGTSSGASFRQGLAAQGGLQGLISGGAGGRDEPSGADATDQHGRAGAEGGAEDTTSDRFAGGTQSALSRFGGAAGQALSTGMGVVQKVGGLGASLLADESNQAGVGHHSYGPDFSSLSGSRPPGRGNQPLKDSPPAGGTEELHMLPPPISTTSTGEPGTAGPSSVAGAGAAGSAVPPVPV